MILAVIFFTLNHLLSFWLRYITSIISLEPVLRHKPLEGAAPFLSLFDVSFSCQFTILWPAGKLAVEVVHEVISRIGSFKFSIKPSPVLGPEFTVSSGSNVPEEEILVCPVARRHGRPEYQVANLFLCFIIWVWLSKDLIDDITLICKIYDLRIPLDVIALHQPLERTFEKDLER